jgi:hypothetical protein
MQPGWTNPIPMAMQQHGGRPKDNSEQNSERQPDQQAHEIAHRHFTLEPRTNVTPAPATWSLQLQSGMKPTAPF